MDSRCLTKGLDMSTIDPRDEHVFPKLTPQEIDRLRRFGEVRRYAPGDALFVRAGTLDNPDAIQPDVHIFTRSKLPWLRLPEGAVAFETAYSIEEVWPEESKARLHRQITAGAHAAG